LITITRRLNEPRAADARLVLPFDQRSKSRLRAMLTTGEEVGVIVERGSVLRGGDLLLAEDGRVVQVVAAEETVSTARTDDMQLLLRAAYHLGNRHVALQIGRGWVRYQHDHVLDDMVRGLGLSVTVEEAPFEPEAGAYGAAHHAHDHRLAPHHAHHGH
jgi:urease accessory protein